MDVPVAVRLVVLSEQDRLVVGETVSVSVTVPVNPPPYVTVTVDEPVDSSRRVRVVGLAAMLNAVPIV
jgi:hypothetical protein